MTARAQLLLLHLAAKVVDVPARTLRRRLWTRIVGDAVDEELDRGDVQIVERWMERCGREMKRREDWREVRKFA